MTEQHRRVAAFTLVELAVVMVVMVLIVGMVVAGQSFVRASETRQLVDQLRQYETAGRQFRLQYNFLPGDMPTATDIWGEANSVGCLNTIRSTPKLTCNGDGDGLIEGNNAANAEVTLFWQHLSNAGLVEDYFNGFFFGANSRPEGPINGTEIMVFHNTTTTDALGYGESFTLTYNHHFYVNGSLGGGAGSFLTPAEMRGLDVKYDDGMPASGKIIAAGGDGGVGGDLALCTSTSDPTVLTATYTSGNEIIGCSFHMRRLFEDQ
jgi:type II secretory pathway pseudopilin PulG